MCISETQIGLQDCDITADDVVNKHCRLSTSGEREYKVCIIIIFYAHWYFIPRGLEINKV